MPAGSKTDPPLAKAKPISASVITYLRREKEQLRRAFAAGERSEKMKAKAQMARHVKDNEKDFNKYVGDKRKTREYVGPLLNETGDLVTQHMEKAFFGSVFPSKMDLQEFQVLEIREKGWRKEYLPLVEEDQVREYLNNLDIHKFMDPDEMHPQVLMELEDVITRPLSMIFDQSWRLGELLKAYRKANVTPIFKKSK
ncbi:mitochondrial enolase superfamily member 1 [Grus japonensis]|uniref:Mitochondrial enolase superfamily member 1 n=1 Tax=Grus japonensis TaxID=30415 RepID=A0ABC9W1M1_GRUJA